MTTCPNSSFLDREPSSTGRSVSGPFTTRVVCRLSGEAGLAKALISVLFDSGCRIGEILTLRTKNIQFDDYGGILLVAGKTCQRRVRIIHSVQRLQTRLDQHPMRNNPETAVFCSISNKSRGTQLSYESISRLLKTIKHRAYVTKNVQSACVPAWTSHAFGTAPNGLAAEAILWMAS